MEENKKLILFELIMVFIAILIFIIITIAIVIQEKDSKEVASTFDTLVSQPISEELQTANLQASQLKIEEIKIKCIENNDENIEEIIIEEKIEVNPYIDIINNLTEYEKELIYKITFAESGNQEEEGQRAVIEVILNRVISKDFPNTVESVLSQPHQFATWGIRNKVRQTDQDRIINILELVAIETPVLPNLEYVFFARGKQTKYATDFIKIQDHWFGAAK